MQHEQKIINFIYFVKFCVPTSPHAEKNWSQEDRDKEKQLMDELVTIIERRNQIISSLDQDRQRYLGGQ